MMSLRFNVTIAIMREGKKVRVTIKDVRAFKLDEALKYVQQDYPGCEILSVVQLPKGK